MAILSRRAGLVFLALCTAGAVASCSVPVPDAGKFGGGDGAVDVEAADSPDLVGDGDGEVSDGAEGDLPDLAVDAQADAELDLEADASPDVAPDSTPDGTDVADADAADVAEDTAETAADANLPECITATDCDDANPCTDDTCDPVTGCVYLPNTVTCTDADACTTATMCKDGTCVGTAVTCDDGNLCTQDSCDKTEGCVYLPNTVTCTDGNACTENDACADGYCKGFGVECDDGNPCTDDLCSKATGCTAVANTAPCDDGDACTSGDACAGAQCAGGKALGCDDGIPCTVDGCDAASGCTHVAQAAACDDQNPCTADTCQVDKGCQYAPAGGPCDDGKACTTGEACAAGKCAGGQWTCACAIDADCDDKDPCTSNTCAAGTCQKADAADGTVCDDGNACLAGDACADGACVGATVVVCDDQNTCTFDVCEPKVGCLNIAHTLACEDGDPCTVSDVCANKTCIAGTAKNCADGNACTDDGCEKGKGCQNTPNTKPCDDDNSCTVGDACKAGACAGAVVSCDDGFACTTDTCNSGAGADPCVYTPKNALCDDKNACTDDSCQVGKGCVNAQNVAPCEDGNVCTKTDVCAEGACKPGAYVCVCKVDGDCDDKNACTKDACEGGLKCANAAVADGATCDDGNACLAGEACSAGKCAGGKAVVCDDQNACTADSCEPASGCKHGNTTAACNDGDACTVGEACSGGACAGGVAKACDDGNLCTTDGCDKASGCVNAANSAKCDDGDACTTVDACQEKACVGSVPPDCDDGNACTTDSCGKVTGCGHVANAEACDDGDACTTVDSCKVGKCVGATPLKCDDGNGCSDDSCEKASGCVYLANAATCTDGDACTVGDACKAKGCVPGKAASCDDGNACTDDGCVKADGCVSLANSGTCTDGDACTTADTCNQGLCVAGPPALFAASFGGNGADSAAGIAAADEGFAILGTTASKGEGGTDMWLVRTDAAGKALWDATYGGAALDGGQAIVALSDGFIAAGYSNSKGAGADDAWLVRTDKSGKVLWDKTYGWNSADYATSLAVLPDGFAVAGWTNRTGLDTNDFWLIRTDSTGTQLWDRTYGGPGLENAASIAAVPGGFAIAGLTNSKGSGGFDMWLVRTDGAGNALWDKTYGGSLNDYAYAVVALPDGFILSGFTESKGAGGMDMWLVRTDENGNVLWDRTYGGTGAERGQSVTAVEGGFLVGGYTSSKGVGGEDGWIVKTDSVGNMLWDKTAGASGNDRITAAMTVSSGYAFAGLTGTTPNMWLVRTDVWGNDSCAKSGKCAGTAAPDCDDAKPCTADWCDGVKGCQHATMPADSPCGAKGFACTAVAECAPKGMVPIPVGAFQMGCVPGDGDCDSDEGPRHEVLLDAFYVDAREVSVAAYATCVTIGNCTVPASGGAYLNWGKTGRQDHPVNGVTWAQSAAYCSWAGKRLPTEAEWEKAARGGLDGTLYPWGNEAPTCSPNQKATLVWYGLGAAGCGKDSTWAVGTGSSKNGYGLLDMAGNVWEWVSDWRGADYYATATKANPPGPVNGTEKVIRGGCYANTYKGDPRASKRVAADPAVGVAGIGFRCARTVSACDPYGCDDGNACTTDSCDEQTGKCTHVAVATGSSCPNGGLCSAQAKCVPPPAGMVGIPAGTFKVGCVPGDNACQPDEGPRHDVTLDAYYLGTTEVTVSAYATCVAAEKCTAPKGGEAMYNWAKIGREQHPVNGVTWPQAEAYCKWTGGRLPTEAEWERAARGGLDGKKFPWGDEEPTCTQGLKNSVVKELGGTSGYGCGTGFTFPVGTGSAKNAFGLYDMAGNVWEWVADWYGGSYYGSTPTANPKGPESGAEKVLRGGSFFFQSSGDLRVSNREDYPAAEAAWDNGFRCARSVSACDPLGCDDGNACTTDTCDEAEGKCVHVAVKKGNACAGGGLCAADGTCVPPPAGMVGVPTGTFKMGCVPGDNACDASEKPQHEVTLSAYYIDLTEVTVDGYAACVGAEKCSAPKGTFAGGSTYNWSAPARGQHPVNGVDWAQAETFCKWKGGRLPTEAEWEKAARGGLEGKKYPWGDSLTCGEAVWAEGSGVGCDGSSTMPAGSKSAGKNAYGLNDMAGNVWEWVADWYGASYYGSSPGLNPQGPSSGADRVLRGGSFGSVDAALVRASSRAGYNPSDVSHVVGFRCSRSCP